ncbi:MAG: hypothetical protein M3O36_14025, partial [Myxococcota bacterium]|nr:hypothetical protein [Myxococcota bacterium]
HVPWQAGDVARGLDVRAGAYFAGGAAVEATLRTSGSVTRVAWDRLRDDGLTLAAHGTTSAESSSVLSETVAWKVDALRGVRAVKMTTDVEAAARPFDRAAAEIAWLLDGWTIGSSVRSTAVRGGDLTGLGAVGPVVVARRSDGLSSWGAYDATAEAGALVVPGTGTLSFARAEGGVSVADRLGAVATTLALRGLGAVSDDGTRSRLGAGGELRAAAGLPLSRDFGSGDQDDPWVHRTEPRVEAAAIGVREDDGALPTGRGMAVPAGGAWVAAGGWSNTLGRAGSRDSAELAVAAGIIGHAGGSATAPKPILRSRAAWQAPWVAWTGELARVFARTEAGGALASHARLGPSTGLHVVAHVEERDGVDPLLARALVEAPLEPASGFFDASGWTGGARIAVPIGRRVTTRVGADIDLTSRELVAALGAVELHDPCNCVVVRATAAHRIGRDGVDVWVSVDLPAR